MQGRVHLNRLPTYLHTIHTQIINTYGQYCVDSWSHGNPDRHWASRQERGWEHGSNPEPSCCEAIVLILVWQSYDGISERQKISTTPDTRHNKGLLWEKGFTNVMVTTSTYSSHSQPAPEKNQVRSGDQEDGVVIMKNNLFKQIMQIRSGKRSAAASLPLGWEIPRDQTDMLLKVV